MTIVVLTSAAGAQSTVRLPDRADLRLVDALAGLKLYATRAGGTIRVREASRDLSALLVFVGLADVLSVED